MKPSSGPTRGKNSPRVIAIETSGRTGSVAVLCGDTILSARLEGARAHAVDLLPQLSALLAQCSPESVDAQMANIELIAVGVGPGSYTGLRIGIATAQGLARASGARLLGVPSLDALAYGELRPGELGSTVFDARAGRFYMARYRRTDCEVETLMAPAAIGAEALRAHLQEAGRIFADERVAEQAALDDETSKRLETPAIPTAKAVLELALARAEAPETSTRSSSSGVASAGAEPLYLRAFGER